MKFGWMKRRAKHNNIAHTAKMSTIADYAHPSIGWKNMMLRWYLVEVIRSAEAQEFFCFSLWNVLNAEPYTGQYARSDRESIPVSQF